MQLVKSRPIALPVFKSGRWYDDFAVTGASDPGYVVALGEKDVLNNGIRLKATSGTSCQLRLPTWFSPISFQAEVIARLSAGSMAAVLEFRRVDDNNRWYVQIDDTSAIKLIKVVASTYTTAGSKSGVEVSKFLRIGISAVGPNISVYQDGIKIISVVDTSNMSAGYCRLYTYNAVVGVAQAEWQYIAIKTL